MRKSARTLVKATALALLIGICLSGPLALGANPQSANIAIIGGQSVINGGWFPMSGYGVPGGMTFTQLSAGNVNTNPSILANYDTILLNVAGNWGMYCNVNNLTLASKAALVNWVGTGKKLIISDSECSPQNYSWLPYPFTTNNPGAMGAQGTLTIAENNSLGSNLAGPYYVSANHLSYSTDAVGDMNVMTTHDANWCLHMTGTNYNHVSGPVQTYVKHIVGGNEGLIVYNGFDTDYMPYDLEWQKVYRFWLLQPFNPAATLPCGHTVVGITLTPQSAKNPVGGSHTVTATLLDLVNNPQANVPVTFTILPGSVNAGVGGTCSPADCKTNAAGQVAFTYTDTNGAGTDTLQASFTNAQGQAVTSNNATKQWFVVGVCDVNADGQVDILDIRLIMAKLNQPASALPNADANADGVINILDSRCCVLKCAKPNCAQ